MSNYDSTEARQLLAAKADELEPDDNARIKAAELLLASLMALNTESGFRINNQAAQHVVSIWFPDNQHAFQPNVSIRYRSNTREFALVRAGSGNQPGPELRLDLSFDPLKKVFLGAERAAPAGHKERESALTTLLREALSHGGAAPEVANS